MILFLWLCILASAAILTALTAAQRSEPGEPAPWPFFGQVDRRDTVITPVRDLWSGQNPYDLAAHTARHPTQQEFSLYSPVQLVLLAPLAALPAPPAGAVWLWGQLIALGLTCWAGLQLRRIDRPTRTARLPSCC